MCSGRVDLEFVLRAFSNGTDGVFIGGCRLNECNYITHGNYDALSNVLLCRKIMEHIGLNPERLRIEFMSSGEGILLAEVINDFCKKVEEIGPLGKSEGINEKGLKFKLEAVTKLIPYVKLVERERLRVPIKSEEEYNKFFASDEVNRLFNELIIDKLAISQIMLLLREKSLSTGEMSEILGLNPSEVSRHMNSSSRHGLVRYDESQKRFALPKVKEQAVN
jgi:F420-non-reducing hydrogenase iron-sulfur subunit